jgi:putative ABC transport system permease protein
MEVEGRETQEGDPPTRMHPRVVTPGYFAAMGIALTRGRGFTADDRAESEPVVVVSEASVRRYWQGRDPLGTRVRYGGEETWRTVVGVAADVRHWGRREDTNPMIYRPQTQAGRGALTFVLHTSGDPAALIRSVRARVADVDPYLPVAGARPLEAVVADSFKAERALMLLMTAFGVLALGLAVLGIYGVMAQLVQARVPEIGVRMTLGARPLDILRRFVAEGLWQAAAGVAIGLAVGVYAMRFAEALLYQVRPWDPVALASVAGVLLAAALAACLIPARRAMRVDPLAALRTE